MAKTISIDKLTTDEHNREYGGTTELATVKTLGILQPLLVTENGDGTYLVLDGHRRLLSAKACGLKKVPCEVVGKEIAENVKLLSNLDRKNLSPYDQFIAMSDLHKLGYDTREIGDIVGTSKYQAERILRLGSLIPEFREMLQRGAITMTQASEICQARDKEQAKLFNDYKVALLDWSAKDIREKILSIRKGFSIASFTDEFLNLKSESDGADCYHCPLNPQTDTLLFEEVKKEESFCTDSSHMCAWHKLQQLGEEKECEKIVRGYYDSTWDEFLKEHGIKLDTLVYPYGETPAEDYENQLKVITLRGEVLYMGGNRKISEDEESKQEKIKALSEKIDTAEANIKECILKAVDVVRTANRKEPLEIMGSRVKLEVLSLANRVTCMSVWDDACGKNLTEALNKAGLLDAAEGREKPKQDDMNSPAVDEILLAIRFDVRVEHILSAIGAKYLLGMYPRSWGDRMANIDMLHAFIEEASERFILWPADKDKLEEIEKSYMRFYDAFDSDIKKKEALEK